jgi:acyl carrier protein
MLSPHTPLARLTRLLDLDEGEAISVETRLDQDLELDSLDRTGLCLAIEGEFALAIPDEEAEHWRTIGDVLQTIESRLP